jgi:tRNA threonylcarbamoyladenosine biosynthesis protein TsaB
MGLRSVKTKRRFRVDPIRSEGELLLAMDTSGPYMNLGLLRGGNLLAAHTSYQPLSHARALLPTIHLLLEEQGFQVGQVDLYGICLGPGSFTGLRVSMSTLKAFCFAFGKQVVGVTTPEVLASAIDGEGPAGVIIDARKGEAYGALLGPGGDEVLLPPEAGTPDGALERLLEAVSSPLVIAGSGCVTYRDVLRDVGGDRIRFAGHRFDRIDPVHLARLCLARHQSGGGVDAGALEPSYVGKPPIHKHRGTGG